RVKLAVELIKSTGLIELSHLLPPRAATLEELALVHSPDYIELVRKLSDPGRRRQVSAEDVDAAGFASADNPISDELHEGTALVVGASLVGAESIQSGAALHAFSPSCGLHHAHRARASGFCTYNDAAVACRWLKDQGHRVAYVDVDVHHGDGVEGIFQSDPDVLTISLHESGRWLFPGTGFPEDAGVGRGRGSVANLPFVPYTWDEPWLSAFEKVVPAMLRRDGRAPRPGDRPRRPVGGGSERGGAGAGLECSTHGPQPAGRGPRDGFRLDRVSPEAARADAGPHRLAADDHAAHLEVGQEP